MKNPPCGGFFIYGGPDYKPNSVAQTPFTGLRDGYLSGRPITRSLKRRSPFGSTALHEGKDLAVSLSGHPETRLQISFQIPQTLPAFRRKRLCSHLAPCGGRALPATRLPVR